MKITNEEAAEIIFRVLSYWNYLSNNPNDLSSMTDHCHTEYSDAELVAELLLKHPDNYLGD